MDEPRAELLARYVSSLALIEEGNLLYAARHISAMMQLAERLRENLWLEMSHWLAHYVASLRGDWAAARHSSDQGLAISPRAAPLLTTRIIMEYQLGQFDEGAHYLERLLDAASAEPNAPVFEHSGVAFAIPMIAHMTGLPDRFDLAEKAAETAFSSPHGFPMFKMVAESGLALMAVARGDGPGCERIYDRMVSAEQYFHWPMMAGHILGLLAAAKGDPEQAVDHFENALQLCRTPGLRPNLAWTCLDYAGTLIRRNQSGDRDKASLLLDEALTLSTELGVKPLIDRAVALRNDADTQSVRTPAYPDGLSAREVEVLRLVSGGKTDREIGEELLISARTVNHHVSNILNKTSAANPAEAATYAARHGITVVPRADSG